MPPFVFLIRDICLLRRGPQDLPYSVSLLVAAAAACVLLADLSQMSRAEVERIWLPFVPWLTLSIVLLPERWRRWGLLAQAVWALLVQQLLYTTW